MPPLRPSTLAALAAFALCAGHAPAAAQRLPPPLAEIRAPAPAWPGRAPLAAPAAPQTDSARARPAYAQMVTGGLLVGAFGAGVAYILVNGASGDIGADVASGMLGGIVAIPFGVHLGNRGRGDPALTIASAVAAGLGTLFLGAAEVEPAELFVLGAPVAALAAAVFAEGRTTR